MLLSSCAQTEVNHKNYSLIACGDNQVVIIDAHESTDDSLSIIWRWRADETINLPREYLPKLVSMDECKPSKDGKSLLLTSSSGATILLDKDSKKALFYAKTPNAHSAEFLPLNRIAVANSVSDGGNSITLYDVDKPEHVLFSDTLYSGHGVVWVPEKESLFALGYQVLKRYSLKDWNTQNPSLHLEEMWTIPGKSGHDLSFVSENSLLLSTHEGVWTFDISSKLFTPFLPLKDTPNVKSVNYNEESKQLIYTKGGANWWTHTIYIDDNSSKKTLQLPEMKLYKVRKAYAR